MAEKKENKIIVSQKIQLLPNFHARQYFAKACGVSRFAYNWALKEWNTIYESGGKPRVGDIDKQFNAIKKTEYPWLYRIDGQLEVSNEVAQRAIKYDLKSAFRAFFDKRARYPKPKKKGVRDSFYVSNMNLKLDEDPQRKRVKISKVGWIRCTKRLRYQGKIMGATISRIADKWFLSVQVEIERPQKLKLTRREIGVEMGVRRLATFSDGSHVPAVKPLYNALKRLQRLQRSFSRMQKGGKNWQKQKLRIAKLHYRIACLRKHTLHQLTAYLTRKYSHIAIRELNVKNMVRNNKWLSQAIIDVGFFEFRRQMEYKAEREGCSLTVLDEFQATSKTCCLCGNVKDYFPLSKIIYRCDQCGMTMDRDINSALNILKMAEDPSFGGSKTLSLPSSQEEEIPPGTLQETNNSQDSLPP